MITVKFPNASLRKDPDRLSWKCDLAKENWKNLRDWLHRHVSHAYPGQQFPSKCWYSEAKLVGDGLAKHVDHFRPKSAATNLTTSQLKRLQDSIRLHPLKHAIAPFFLGLQASQSQTGYVWLACEPENYRLSHPTVNSSNKNSVFPILVGSSRLSQGGTPSSEFALLLDPTSASDVELLMIGRDGMATYTFDFSAPPIGALPVSLFQSDAVRFARSLISIEVFGLNHTDFVAERRRRFLNIAELCDRAQQAIQSHNLDLLKSSISDIHNLSICPAEYSGTSRWAIKSWISDHNSSPTYQKAISILMKIIQRILLREQ